MCVAQHALCRSPARGTRLRSRFSRSQSVLTSVSNSGFKPFYVVKQPGAEYLQVQEGSFSLYDKYEVTLGNVKRKVLP